MAANWRSGAGSCPEDELNFEITANAFLYHMVRRLVSTHTAVGLGMLEIEDLQQHLLNPQAEPIQGLAPPQGLVLVKVNYTAGNGENKET